MLIVDELGGRIETENFPRTRLAILVHQYEEYKKLYNSVGIGGIPQNRNDKIRRQHYRSQMDNLVVAIKKEEKKNGKK